MVFNQLPTELIQLIGNQLRVEDLIALSNVNKRFNRILRDPKYLVKLRPLNYYQTIKIPQIDPIGKIKMTQIYICSHCCRTMSHWTDDNEPFFKCRIPCKACLQIGCIKSYHIVNDNNYYYYVCTSCLTEG